MIESITNADLQPKSTGRTLLIGFLIALMLTALVGVGMMFLQRRNAAKLAMQQKAAKPAPTPHPSPELQVLMDEAQIKAGQAALTGTVKNISSNTISNISVDFQLYHRQGNAIEVKTLVPLPNDLPPNAEAKYQFAVPQKAFHTLRVLKINSNAGHELAFVTMPGTKRPDEGPTTVTTVVGGPAKSKDKGEIFINTPDNPETVP